MIFDTERNEIDVLEVLKGIRVITSSEIRGAWSGKSGSEDFNQEAPVKDYKKQLSKAVKRKCGKCGKPGHRSDNCDKFVNGQQRPSVARQVSGVAAGIRAGTKGRRNSTTTRNMKIYTWEDPIRFTTKVAFVSDDGNTFKAAFNFATETAYTIKPGEELPKGYFMNIPRDVFEEMLKGFAELANKKGLKLDSDLKREGKLEATERHLQDMRRIVFKAK